MIAHLEIMPGGSFDAQARTVGAEDGEIEPLQRGDLPKERVDVIADNLRRAAIMLSNAVPMGRC